jgi:pimeloyl-ACP methyl ester carboxylesterase
METLRLSFAIPRAKQPAAGWPVVIIDTGTGSNYHSYYDGGFADIMAANGLAVIAIDPVLSGNRDLAGNPEFDFYNFNNPETSRNNAIQGATDSFSIVRLVQGFSYTEAPVGTDAGRTVRFDPANIFYFGHSQGGITGAPFLAFEPEVKATVLSGAAALLFEVLVTKTQPFDIKTLVASYIPDEPLDEFNPVLAMVQTWVERSEPANYGRLLARATVTGDDGQKLAPKDVFQTEGFDDHFAPGRTVEAFATAIGGNQLYGLDGANPWPPVKGLELRGRDVLTPPVTGNLAGKTVVLAQYRQAAGSDGHFVVFDVPAASRAWSQFLVTRATTGVATAIH